MCKTLNLQEKIPFGIQNGDRNKLKVFRFLYNSAQEKEDMYQLTMKEIHQLHQ